MRISACVASGVSLHMWLVSEGESWRAMLAARGETRRGGSQGISRSWVRAETPLYRTVSFGDTARSEKASETSCWVHQGLLAETESQEGV